MSSGPKAKLIEAVGTLVMRFQDAAQKFDADAQYIKQHLPELGKLPAEAAHAPWLAKAGQLGHSSKGTGARLGIDYPEPIVSLGASRQRALDAYEAIRSG